ncbi:MAG: universal stress protein [Haloarculaceae archaeon]
MTKVVVPVRYPLTEQSRATLSEAIRVAEEEDAELTVLHVNQYQSNRGVSRSDLRRAVEEAFGHLPNTRYAVRKGLLVEETLLEELLEQRADVVVIGKRQLTPWRNMVRRLLDEPDVEGVLRERLDCRIVTASP